VKTPEQLPLDFSASKAESMPAPLGLGAVVYEIENYRARGSQVATATLSAVYDAIHDAVKHVTVRPRAPRDSFVESRHS
jgi:hypothetical protein